MPVLEEEPPAARPRIDLGDIVALAVLGVAAGGCAWVLQATADPRFLTAPLGNDVWFEADLPTVTSGILHRWDDQSRNARHALFPLLATVPVYAFRSGGCSEAFALRLLVSGWAVAWSAALYILIRGVAVRRTDAILFAVLGHVTAAAMFWVPVPETYTLGSISVMLAMALALWDPGGVRHAAWYVAAAAFSLATTTSNWLTGLAAIASRHHWRRTLQIAANSLSIVVVIWGVQRVAFPTAPFFIGEGVQTRFVLPYGLAGIPHTVRAMLFHSIVMPAIGIAHEPTWGSIMSVQEAGLASSGVLGAIATVAWGTLLALGVWTLATRRSAARLPLALAIAGHLLLGALYGDETFLYTLHVAPLLVSVAAAATMNTRARPIVLALAAALVLLLAANNWAQLSGARSFFGAVTVK